MNMEIIVIASLVSSSCALCGVFLVLRKMSLMSDAISHSILIGIVLGFFISKSFNSMLPIAGAVVAGFVSVLFTELLQKTKLIKSDAAIGLVFPFLFGLGVIAVSLYAGNIHLDTDSVLLGEIAFAPFDRINFLGFSLPKSLIQMSLILIFDLIFIILFFKELKFTTFDPASAQLSGFSPAKLHYGLMFAVTLTCVGAFDSAGAVLVTALMIAPAGASLLLTDNLLYTLIVSVIIACIASISGFYLAIKIDGSIAGAISLMTGIIFAAVYLFSPGHGLIFKQIKKRKLKIEFFVKMLVIHLLHHQGSESMKYECREEHLTEHINMSKKTAGAVVMQAEKMEYIKKENGILVLLPKGKTEAVNSLLNI
ncbi:metal ABC transporter permease [Treponema pedis]|uniref:Metal ABC transporter permease n=2 Tax=Treponema pedis TaxID=409322 RepID=A0A7S7AVR4_9SPIR|nr:metal ABC transporter permease [Treponema pedis]QOW60470.1 metal ABC transporter permease [Treponema pedis]